MNPYGPLSRLIFTLVLLVALCRGDVARAQVYIAYMNSGVVSEFDEATGASVNDMFILGLKEPRGLCVAHGMLYVLQSSGSIGTYNLQTGAAIREQLVTGLNYPQVMTVADDAIYVVDTDWQTRLPKIEKYNARTGALINPAFITIKAAEHDGVNYGASIPTSLAVSGNRLFVTNVDFEHGLMVYDTATGKVIADHFLPYPINPYGLVTSGKWVYFCIGPAVFQLDAETGATRFGVPGHPAPMGTTFNNPKRLAISGDDLLVGEGVATAIGKYNATTGELIKADFIPSQHDQLGGLAAVPRESTQVELDINSQFEWHRTLFEWWFAFMKGEDTYLFAGCCVLALIALIVAAFALRAKAPVPVIAAEEPVADPVEPVVAPVAEEEPAPIVEEAPAPPREPQGISGLVLVAITILVVTLGAAAYMGYSLLMPTGTDANMYGDKQSDLLSGWSYENDYPSGREKPVLLGLMIYSSGIEYYESNESNQSYHKPGKWHDNAFWISHDDGSPETEAARLIDPFNIEVNLSAFDPDRTGKPRLYKVEGSAAEKAAIDAKYPGPITYPPRKGVITYFMSEYDLNALPWHADHREMNGGDEPYSRGITYHYHSDNPQVPALDVMVKNHQVVLIKGGYDGRYAR